VDASQNLAKVRAGRSNRLARSKFQKEKQFLITATRDHVSLTQLDVAPGGLIRVELESGP